MKMNNARSKKFLSFGLKKTQTQKIPILRCRYTAANYTIDVSFANVLTENTRIIHIKYVHLNCCIVFYFASSISILTDLVKYSNR